MTILFKKDWNNKDGKPRALVDYNTKNTSFLKMSKVLQLMGIENNKFMLSLYDYNLVNVDPYSLNNVTDPTGELRQRVLIETSTNIWYYLREVIRIPTDGGDSVPFRLNRANMALTWLYLNHINVFLVQPRQTGKAQPLTANVLTPSGFVTMGSLKVGDNVLTPIGDTVKILGVYPQGIRPTYTITLEDGRSTRADIEHLWNISTDDCSYKTYTTKDLLQFLKDDVNIYINNITFTPKDTSVSFITTPKTRIVSIEYFGEEECQCISIGHYDKLYITDDYIVTHNTIGITAIHSWLFGFKKNTTIGSLVHDTTLLQDNVQHIKRMVSELPDYLYMKNTKDTDNKEGLSYTILNNVYKPRVGRTDKLAAKKIGRGFTSANLHFDELPYIANILYTYPVIMGSTSAALDLARKNDTPHCTAITTTAGDPNDAGGQFALDIISDAMKFSETLYDIDNIKELVDFILANSGNNKSPMVFCNFNHRQLGHSDSWLEERIEFSRATPDVADREFRCIWKTSSNNPIVDPIIMNLIESHKKHEPDYVEKFNDYLIYWYVDKSEVKAYENKPFIIGLDSSDMIGNDFTTFVGVDPSNLRVIFTFRCNVSTIPKMSVFVTNFLIKYPYSVLVPERKSSAPAIIDWTAEGLLKNGMNPYRRIFNYVVQNKELEAYKDLDINDTSLFNSNVRNRLGFMTDSTRRTLLYKDILKSATELSYDKICDPSIINELAGLTRKDDNKVDHKAGQHDDTVMAWLLACYLLLEGKNLHFYGLQSNKILSDVPNVKGTTLDKDHVKRQTILKQYVKQLVEKRDSTNNEYVRKIIQQKINEVIDYVDGSVDDEPLTVNDLQSNFNKYQNVTPPTNTSPISRWLRSRS